MKKELKPKCYLCRKKGMEVLYIWFNGHLSHYTCVRDIDRIIMERMGTRKK